jgi:hypothetical protein
VGGLPIDVNEPDLGTVTDAPASLTAYETGAARTGISLWKGIKNLLIDISTSAYALYRAFNTRIPAALAANGGLKVEGVGNVEDYAGVLRYLEGLAVVKSVQLASANGATLVFDVSTGGQLRQLIETLALDRRLQPLGEPAREGQRFNLYYQWQGP